MTKTKITQNPLFLPLICVLLVLAVNVVYDISQEIGRASCRERV